MDGEPPTQMTGAKSCGVPYREGTAEMNPSFHTATPGFPAERSTFYEKGD
jgi:hypothetical protein